MGTSCGESGPVVWTPWGWSVHNLWAAGATGGLRAVVTCGYTSTTLWTRKYVEPDG